MPLAGAVVFGLLTFIISAHLLGDRLQLLSALFLTCFAIQWTVNDRLPRVAYSSVRNKGDCPELHLSGISRHFSGRRIPFSAGRERWHFCPSGGQHALVLGPDDHENGTNFASDRL